MASDSREKFQALLRELFQFDVADLDFGIYRIMNHKRQVIERWITEDLPLAIENALREGKLAEQEQAKRALEEARQKVLETLGQEAIDTEGNLDERYVNTPLGKAYLEAQKKAEHAQRSEALETAVYNHLYTFFSRYYQDGDFISKRRYSKRERYAIPYNGEEVYLYWANHDQYYVKTAEHFTDYTWKAPNGVTVHFKLQAADVEQDNVKGEKRFFLPVLDEMAWEEASRTLTIPFEYRPLTGREITAYGRSDQQGSILQEALKSIPRRLKGNTKALAALTTERRKDAKGEPVSYLEHHLRQYTARNTRDFFIHKDLKGFLSRELDFYLKNEVLNLDELEAAGEELSEGWFQLMRLIKRVGNAIIDFLAQIEDFQKALWEKKKFVTEAFYVITVGNIPEGFYPEIAACEAQWQEWQDLLCIHELPQNIFSGDLRTLEGRIAFLKAHPSLPLDTRHFPQSFTDRLLASFGNLDEVTDGLLIHSENWQALNLLQEKYRERVKTIYIDPPYNTGSDEFLYRDNYQHSSWLAMMFDRLLLADEILNSVGVIVVSEDESEIDRLRVLMDDIFKPDKFLGKIIWKRRSSPPNDKVFGAQHEYALVYAKSDQKNCLNLRTRSQKQLKRYTNPDNHPKGPWTPGDLLANVKGGRYVESLYFPIVNPRTGQEYYPPPGGNWRFNKETIQELLERDEIWFGKDDKGRPKLKRFLCDVKTGITWTTLWDFVPLNATGSNEMQSLFGSDLAFENPKPVGYVRTILEMSSCGEDIALDFFAGSGTTSHAVINLNREDGGRRKFILVEMADYFDTVLLPRIKKVTFSPKWNGGKPECLATQKEFERGPRLVKVIRLESYEDALNNIAFDEESGPQALDLFGDEYLLRYMLRWESRKSETFLDVEKLRSPFSYKLHIHRDGETRAQAVDLPETFNYLIGLDVETRQAYNDNGRRYLVYRGTMRNGRKVAILWRETQGWMQEDYERDAAFVAEQRMTEGVDEIFINGDSIVPGVQSLDGLFKARLFGGVEG